MIDRREARGEDYGEGVTTLDRLLTVREAAAVLAVSRPTLERIIRRGELVPVRIGSRRRFLPNDLRDYIERGREERVPRTIANPGSHRGEDV